MPDPRSAGLAALLLAGLLAGCVLPAGDVPAGAAADGPGPSDRPVVVALIDTGIDPYHVAFTASEGRGAERWADGFGAQVVTLSREGDHAARVQSDHAFWETVEPGVLYAFAGTRVLGISLGHDPDEFVLRDHVDTLGHGTATSSMVARDAPDALLVMIQVDVTSCEVNRFPESCPVNAIVSPAMAWAARQPWIDVVSVSMGGTGNPPDSELLTPEVGAYLEASRQAHDAGKVLVNAAGNSVTPPLPAHRAGPPWVIAAGGAEPEQRGESVAASKGADVAANYTEWAAVVGTLDEYSARSGTSYAAPLVAATLARALHDIRSTLGPAAPGSVELASGVTAAHLRAALNATALPWAPTDWDPTQPGSNNTLTGLLTPSAPVLAPGPQMGWGYVHAGLADEVARRVLAEDFSIPAEKAQTAAYMGQFQSLRETYWQNMR